MKRLILGCVAIVVGIASIVLFISLKLATIDVILFSCFSATLLVAGVLFLIDYIKEKIQPNAFKKTNDVTEKSEE
jgi:predicted membrane protein